MQHDGRRRPPHGLESWFVAGFVAGLERALSGRSPQEEFFTALARGLLEGDSPGMRNLLERVTAAYGALPPARRLAIAGEHSGLDVQLPLDRVPDEPAGAPLAQARGDAKPDKRGEDPLPTKQPDLVAQPRRGDCECCRELVVMLERIRIVDDTDGAGADDVLVTALSTGVVIQGVQAFKWPTGPGPGGPPEPQEMNTGDSATPNVVIARVRPDSGCRFSLESEIRFWEIDDNEIDELMRRAIVDLVQQLSAKAGVLGAPGSVVGLIGALVDALIDLLDLADNQMGTMGLSVSGRLCSKPDVTTLGWAPPWKAQQQDAGGLRHDRVDEHTARVGQRLRNLGGDWEVSVLVQRLCN